MDKFTTVSGVAAPLNMVNVDTDMIIPKQFLKTIKRTGLGKNLFDEMRYNQDGTEKPDFVLNKPAYRHAKILIAGNNFGCGSSREHAPWALADFGIRCVIAPSFADIFSSNAGKNGIVLARLTEDEVQTLLARCTADPQHKITINLEAQTVTDEQGFSAHFEIDPFRKYCLLNGLDDIGLTLRHEAELDSYEAMHDAEFWQAPKLVKA